MSDRRKRSRSLTYGSSTLFSAILFLGILAVIALIAQKHPWRVDLTESGEFTLSGQTRNILKSINEPIRIKAFFATASPEWAEAKDLLESYHYENNKIVYELVDPDRQPEVAKHYDIRAYGTLVLEGYGKEQTVQNADEESITNAILKLTRKQEKKIYFLIGHGEHSLEAFDKEGYSSAKSALEKENYNVAELNLLQREKVPEDAAVVVIAGPHKDLFASEIASLKSYLESGGKILVFLDPGNDAGLSPFLKQYGIEIQDDIVIDKLSRVFGGSYLLPVVTEYGLHKITQNFDLATFYSEARSVRPVKEPPEGVQVQVLASTSPNAWAETDLELIRQGQASFDEKTDMAGPVPLIVLAEIEHRPTEEEKKTSLKDGNEKEKVEKKTEAAQPQKGFLLVVGDSDFVNNTHFGLSGNGDFFLNMVNFLAEEENLITIEPREGKGQPMLLTQTQAQLFFWTVLILIPLTVVLVGISVYRVRRSRR